MENLRSVSYKVRANGSEQLPVNGLTVAFLCCKVHPSQKLFADNRAMARLETPDKLPHQIIGLVSGLLFLIETPVLKAQYHKGAAKSATDVTQSHAASKGSTQRKGHVFI